MKARTISGLIEPVPLQEDFREPDKIQYFEEFCTEHWGECELREESK